MTVRDLVLIPGTLCDARVFDEMVVRLPGWRAQVHELGKHARVEEVADAILAAAPARFVAAGFSLGGFVALDLLRRAPERVAGVVLIAGNAHPDASENASSRRLDVARSRAEGMKRFITVSAPHWGIADRPSVLERVVAMANAAGSEAHARQAEMNIARPDLREVARQATVPVIVLAGETDRLCAGERYSAAASGPTGELIHVAGAGHYLPLEAPEAVAAAFSRLEDRL